MLRNKTNDVVNIQLRQYTMQSAECFKSYVVPFKTAG